MFINENLLVRLGACEDRAAFVERFPQGAVVTPELCVAHADAMNWGWVVASLLTAAERREVERRTRDAQRAANSEITAADAAHRDRLRQLRAEHPAMAERERLLDAASIGHDAGLKAAYAAQEAARLAADERHRAERIAAQRAYEEALAAARARYDEVMLPARQAYREAEVAALASRALTRQRVIDRFKAEHEAYRAAVAEAEQAHRGRVAGLSAGYNVCVARAFGEVAQGVDRYPAPPGWTGPGQPVAPPAEPARAKPEPAGAGAERREEATTGRPATMHGYVPVAAEPAAAAAAPAKEPPATPPPTVAPPGGSNPLYRAVTPAWPTSPHPWRVDGFRVYTEPW